MILNVTCPKCKNEVSIEVEARECKWFTDTFNVSASIFKKCPKCDYVMYLELILTYDGIGLCL